MHGFDKGVIEGREHEEWKWDTEVACLGVSQMCVLSARLFRG